MPDALRIRFLDVGHGDAIVGILPGSRRAFIVDVFKADPVLDFLDSEGITEVILFLTHSDRDHTLGAQDLLAELVAEHNPVRVLAIFCSRDRINATKGSEYRRLISFIGRVERRLARQDPRNPSGDFNTLLNQVDVFAPLFQPVRISVVHPTKADQDSLIGVDTNETSGVLLVAHAIKDGVVRRVLLAADVQLTGISLLLDREDYWPICAEVMKYPHHGAWPTSWPGIEAIGTEIKRRSMADFLNRVMPAIIVFSVGQDNPYGHIRPEVLDLLATYMKETGRLRMVKWTQITPTCSQPGILPAEGPLAEPAGAGDIEVRLGEYPDEDYVSVNCTGVGSNDRTTGAD